MYRKTILFVLLSLCLSITLIANAREHIESGGGFFDNPQAIGVDPIQQFIYVADTGNHRIQIFTSNTIEPTWEVGSQGSGDNELESPSGIALDSEGFIFVADTGNDRIVRFDRAVFKDTTDPIVMLDVYTEASLGLSMDGPRGLGIDDQDRIYIADTGSGRVHVIATGTWLGDVGDGPGDEFGSFVAPVDVAVCPLDQRIYVLDRDRPGVQIFEPFDDGADFVSAFGVEGDAPGFMDSPTGFTLDARCTVYVADTGNNRMQVFDRDGGVIETFGDFLSGPTSAAVDMITPQGFVYVSSSGSDQYHVYEWVDYDTTGDNDNDSDGDGLPDLWETHGVDYNGDSTIDFDLPAMDADPHRKDIFVEFDFMTGFEPDPLEIDAVIAAFAAAPVDNPDGSTGITLHVEIDEATPHVEQLIMWDEYDTIKADFFGTAAQRGAANADDVLAAKRFVYHYALNANRLCGAIDENTPPNCIDDAGLGGLSDLGPNFVVSLGINQGEAGEMRRTFMHELGHSVGLLHGGGDSTNCKPNYLSIMNYVYAPSDALQDYETGVPVLDYSREHLPALEEDSLVEDDGIGDGPLRAIWSYAPFLLKNGSGSGALDWNNSGAIDAATVAVDLNAVPIRECQVAEEDYPVYQTLTGHDDWSNLDYNFRNNGGFYFSALHPDFVPPDDFPIEELDELGRCIDQGICGVPPYEYAAKMICGFQRGDPIDLRLGPGAYAASINIHNPNRDDVEFFVKLALATPPNEIAPGEILPIGSFRLAYDEALSVDCNNMTAELFDGTLPAPYIDGFLIVQAAASLDVTGVYSVSGIDEGGRPTIPSDVEIVSIAERVRLPDEPEDPPQEMDTADIEVMKRVSVDETSSNSTNRAVYSVLVTNNGPNFVEDVQVRDELVMVAGTLVAVPAGEFATTHGTGWAVVSQNGDGVVLEAVIPTLASGEFARLDFAVIVRLDRTQQRTEMENTAEAEAALLDPVPDNNTDTLMTIITVP